MSVLHVTDSGAGSNSKLERPTAEKFWCAPSLLCGALQVGGHNKKTFWARLTVSFQFWRDDAKNYERSRLHQYYMPARVYYMEQYEWCRFQSSSPRMRVINHNWSAMKQRLHLQSVAQISRHSVLSGDRIRQCKTSSGSRHKDTDQCL